MKKPTVEQTEEALRIIEKATTEEVGQRCPDYEPYCVVCEAWLHFDGVKRTVHSYIDTLENYEDPSDYVGMGWLIAEGGHDEESCQLREVLQMLSEIDKDQIDEIYVETLCTAVRRSLLV
jgi:hypothetical protein